MENVKMITKILIANRGEIARRIIRTSRDMGVSRTRSGVGRKPGTSGKGNLRPRH